MFWGYFLHSGGGVLLSTYKLNSALATQNLATTLAVNNTSITQSSTALDFSTVQNYGYDVYDSMTNTGYYLNGEELIINGQIWNEDFAQNTTNTIISSNTAITAQPMAPAPSNGTHKCPYCESTNVYLTADGWCQDNNETALSSIELGIYMHCHNCGKYFNNSDEEVDMYGNSIDFTTTEPTPTKIFKIDKGNFTISGSSYSYSSVGRAIYQTGGTLTLIGDTFNGFSTRGTDIGGIIYQEGGTLNLGTNNIITTTSDYAIYAGGTLNLTGDSAISATTAGIYLAENSYLTINANLTNSYTLYKENITTYSGTASGGCVIAYSTNSTYLQNFLNNLTITNIGDYSFWIDGNYIVIGCAVPISCYVDGELYNVKAKANKELSEAIPTIKDEWTSNDENTCGWFLDSGLTNVASRQDIVEGVTLYTKTATLDKIAQKSSDDTTCYIYRKSTSGELVLPNIYNGKTVQIYSINYSSGAAFYNCTSLTSVVLNSYCTSVSNYAFYSCSGLTSITIPDSVISIGTYAFYNCTSLTSATIGGGVTSIATYAFGSCSSLTSVTIPGSVTSIASNAFNSCSNLTSVYSSSLSDWLNISFGWPSFSVAHSLYFNNVLATDITIPDGVTSICDYAFYNCSSITSLTIPDGMTSIGVLAFSYCTSLENVYSLSLNDWLNITIGRGSFDHGYSLYLNNVLATDITIPGSVTSIGEYAFQYCRSLASVTIPDSVTSIGADAFYGCSKLTKVYSPSLSDWLNITLTYRSFEEHSLYFNNVLATDITIPDGVTSIDCAFSYCTSLTSISIPDSVTSIGNAAFYNCSSLTNITIPDSVTSIGNSAFYNCRGLTSIYIPSSVLTITASYFLNCPFYNCFSSLKIYCGVVSENDIPSGWGKYWNYNGGSYLSTNWGYSRVEYCNEVHGTSYTVKDVTCTEDGYSYSDCDICGHIESVLKSALGHNVEEWTIDAEPTCTSEGSRSGTCTRCGEIVTEAIEKIPHNYVDKVCTVCGEEQTFTITFSSTYPFAYDSSTGYWKPGNSRVNSSTSQMIITASDSLTVSFDYKASSESSCDKFTIIFNGATKVTSSGDNQSFTSYSITLSTGDVLTLQYYKDSSSHKYDDTVYIQNLTIGGNAITSDNVSFSGGGAMVGQLMAYRVSVANIEEPTDTVTAYVEQEKKYLMGAVLNKKLFGNDED